MPDPSTPDRRCHECGHALVGLPDESGTCPECGTPYTAESARRLHPFPSAFVICCRLGWPIAGLLVASLLIVTDPNQTGPWVLGIVLGYAMVVCTAANSYFQIRAMLRESLPHRVRTRGPVAIFRAIGTVICMLVLLVFVGAPILLGVGCLIILAG